MKRTIWFSRLRERLFTSGVFDWGLRLALCCGGTFLIYGIAKSALGVPLALPRDVFVILLATLPVFALSGAMHYRTSRDLAAMTGTAQTDELTGLMNRRGFVTAMETVGHGAIIIIDIDHFKYVNDRYGHAAGDEVLRAMADHLQRNTRQHDLVARLGGEEFGLFLPGCDSLEIDQIGDRLCAGFVLYNEKVPAPIKVTMSAGAAFSLMSRGKDELIQNADQALYQAKRSGRARLAFWQPPLTSR